VVTSVSAEGAVAIFRVEVNQCGKCAYWQGSEKWGLGQSEQGGLAIQFLMTKSLQYH
jgi:hypothetical protein